MTINEQRGHEFGREQKRVCVKVWRKKREERNDVSTISERKKNDIPLKSITVVAITEY